MLFSRDLDLILSTLNPDIDEEFETTDSKFEDVILHSYRIQLNAVAMS